jgi:hypothetical protein
MIDYNLTYDLNTQIVGGIIQHFFVSQGKSDIVKAIQYQRLGEYNGNLIFNLGFGDYNAKTKEITDDHNSNNGDHYRLFNTILSTIPHFFNYSPHSYLIVMGSDNKPGFPDICRIDCSKRCPPTICKNFRRRIRTYQGYVEKNWQLLNKEYGFEGGLLNKDGQVLMEDYLPGRSYDAVLIFKRKA